MHREHTLHLLQRYIPGDEENERKKNEMIRFIEQNERCFERNSLEGHITASSWLVDKTGTNALIMFHKKLQKWLQLGGHCDGEMYPLEVAIKEAQEESGIHHIKAVTTDIFDLDIHDIPPYRDTPAHLHYDIRFLLQVTSDESPLQNEESEVLRWIAHDGDHSMIGSESVMRMINYWKRALDLRLIREKISS